MSNSMPENTTFLIVDDCDVVRESLRNDLLALGFSGKIYEAEDGSVALETLNQSVTSEFPVEFIISDMEMPNCTGLQFLKKMRMAPEFSKLPFLMLTNNSDRATVLQCISSGATNYLLKPWNKQSLAEKISFSWEKCTAG